MSPLQLQEQLDSLAFMIRDLRRRILDAEREANEAFDDKSVDAAFVIKTHLSEALRAYFDLAELSRDRVCPIHGQPAVSSCPDCIRVAERLGDESHVRLQTA